VAKKLKPLDVQPGPLPEQDEDREELFEQPEGGEKKPRSRAWNFFRPVIITVASLAIVAGLVYYAYDYVKGHYFDPVNPESTEAVEITIEPRSSLSTIAEVLEENGIIKDKTVFKMYTDFSDMSSKLKAGTYVLSPSMSYDDIIYTLSKGLNTTPIVRLTFKEGLGVDDYGAMLVENGFLKNDTRYKEICTTGESFTQYNIIQDVIIGNSRAEEKRRYVLEGYLFPETYDYYRDASEEDLIKKQLEQFQIVFNDIYQDRAEELGMTVDEVVILASIIEKEAKTDDFKKVSAVFHNRMDEGMRLDSDATLGYYLGTNRLMFTEEELNLDTKYNTRLYEGLPPGPIGNPGKAAIEAALYPEEEYLDRYYYFTLKDPATGELVFAETLDEHNANVEQYQHLYEQADEQGAEGETN